MSQANQLLNQHCQPLDKSTPPLTPTEAQALLEQTPQWQLTEDNSTIERKFSFKNFYETIAFVNAVAWIANQEDHHPDLEVGYNRCVIHFTTHDVGGLSRNDFICAAKIDAL